MLPGTLYRVEYLEGFGWPERTRQERTKRTYDTADSAARMVDTIQALPSHHRLLHVYRGRVRWTEINADDLRESNCAH